MQHQSASSAAAARLQTAVTAGARRTNDGRRAGQSQRQGLPVTNWTAAAICSRRGCDPPAMLPSQCVAVALPPARVARCSLLARPLAILVRLENLGSAVVPPHLVRHIFLPLALMLQRGLVRVQVPWRVGHELQRGRAAPGQPGIRARRQQGIAWACQRCAAAADAIAVLQAPGTTKAAGRGRTELALEHSQRPNHSPPGCAG